LSSTGQGRVCQGSGGDPYGWVAVERREKQDLIQMAVVQEEEQVVQERGRGCRRGRSRWPPLSFLLLCQLTADPLVASHPPP